MTSKSKKESGRPLARTDTSPQGSCVLEAGARDFINPKSVDQGGCMAVLTVRMEGGRP